jgi:hypothetical protein
VCLRLLGHVLWQALSETPCPDRQAVAQYAAAVEVGLFIHIVFELQSVICQRDAQQAPGICLAAPACIGLIACWCLVTVWRAATMLSGSCVAACVDLTPCWCLVTVWRAATMLSGSCVAACVDLTPCW